jgi:phosphate transport system permease protein
MTKTAPNAPGPERRKPGRAASSLLAQGEPMLWLTGGALAVSLVMIVALVLLVLVRGGSTFWPAAVVQVETVEGATHLGEVSRRERHVLTEEGVSRMDGEIARRAQQRLASGEPEVLRRLVRTGNFELTGVHFNWVAEHEIASESEPEWALVAEREEWGRFYGFPVAFEIDGERVAGSAGEAWAKYREHHGDVHDRVAERKDLEAHDVGRVNLRLEKARLARRSAELEHGKESAEWAAADAAYLETEPWANEEFARIRRDIEALDEKNERYQLILRTADGNEVSLGLAGIVRAYPANQLGVGAKLGTCLSRWTEFLIADPREANSEGGVFPAIFGTVVMTLLMTLVVVPFGVLAALYLREYVKPGAIVSMVRVAINNLAGVPSIVFGVFGLGFFCYVVGAGMDQALFAEHLPNPTFGKGGIMWASLTLALLTLPVVIVATEEALAAVPRTMREGSYACGASKWQTILRIVLPRAMPGIMTGMILAMARGAGEVAPLMLVGAVKLAPELPLDGVAPFLHPERSFMHLGFHIYDLGFQSQNSEAAKPMVFTTTLLLISIVAALNVSAILIRTRLRKKFKGSQF